MQFFMLEKKALHIRLIGHFVKIFCCNLALLGFNIDTIFINDHLKQRLYYESPWLVDSKSHFSFIF